jgi:hypothetical protein
VVRDYRSGLRERECVRGGRTLEEGVGQGAAAQTRRSSPCQSRFWFGNPEEGYYTVVEEKEGH